MANTTKGRRQPPANGVKFSKENQPPPENKSAGMLRKLKGQELVKAILNLAFHGLKDGQLKKAAAEYYMTTEDQITVEMMMHFRQAEKAIQKGDTQAYHAIMSRGFGLPKQTHELSGDPDHPISITLNLNSNDPKP